jgi:purine-binding chemotaxis protein CheW
MAEIRETFAGRGDRAASAAADDSAQSWFFCMKLLGARYAFEAPLVTEVVRLGPLTRLPAAPSFLPGVFMHRGEVLPVLDIHQLMGQQSIPIRANTRAAIVHCGAWRVAVIAEAVEGLVGVPCKHLEPPPGEATGIAEFLTAVGRDRGGTVAILDLPRLVEAARARSVPA